MSKNNDFWKIGKLKNVKVLCCVALFVAISIISGKFLAISLGDIIRISFENLTIILSGMMFGPIVGAITGVCADLLGCILRGYNIIPVLTIGAASIGFFAGVTYNFSFKLSAFVKILLSCLIPHLIGSVVIKSIGLSLYYDMPLVETFITRCINYMIVISAETFVLYVLVRNKAFVTQIKRIKR